MPHSSSPMPPELSGEASYGTKDEAGSPQTCHQCGEEGFVRNAASKSAHSPYGITCAFRNAGNGVLLGFKTQRNMRVHGVVAVLAIVLGIVLRISAVEWAVVALCIAAVMAAELVNTAIEATVDLVTSEYALLAKHAKDCAAGAVLVTAVGAVFVASFIYIPAFLNLIMI